MAGFPKGGSRGAMNIRDMEYIVAVVDHGSITAAAKSLFITQPSLTQCVQRVERELGGRIFTRGQNGVALTDEGVCFADYARDVLRGKQAYERRLMDVRDLRQGNIVLGFTGAQAPLVIPYVLPVFQERYPGIAVTLYEGPSGQIEKRLLDRKVDIGILHPPVLSAGLEYFELSRDRMVALPRSGSGYEKYVFYKEGESRPYLDLEFFRGEKIALTTSAQRSRMVCDRIFANAGIVPDISMQTSNISTLDTMARIGYASTLLPEKQLSKENARRGFFLIDERFAVPYSFVAAVPKEAYISAAVRRFRDVLRELRHTF